MVEKTNDTMKTPYESDEFREKIKWEENSKGKKLIPIPCIAAWIDICGFGSELEKASWDLNELQNQNIFQLLSEVYSLTAEPFLVGVSPYPFESTLIINDGIAKTVDLMHLDKTSEFAIIKYIEKLIVAHILVLKRSKEFKLGARTVLAGGQRVEYSPKKITGKSLSYYDSENTSPFMTQLLKQDFLYNPAEFQMNTAFAKAYSIDAVGSDSGFHTNGLYIEQDFIKNISQHPNIKIEIHDSIIKIELSEKNFLVLTISEELTFNFKGLQTLVYKIKDIKLPEDEGVFQVSDEK